MIAICTVNGYFSGTVGDGSIDEGMNTQRMEDGELELLQSARKTLSLVLTWERMFAYITIVGMVRFTKEKYNIIAVLIKDLKPCLKPVTYKTIRGAQWDRLLQCCFPKSDLYRAVNNDGISSFSAASVVT